MKTIVGIFTDKDKMGLAQSELSVAGYKIKRVAKSGLTKLGLPVETIPIYKSKMQEGGVLVMVDIEGEVDAGREILENHGAEQIRTV